MKKINYLWLLAGALAFASCNNEELPKQETGVDAKPGTFSFTIPASKKVTTYADIATADENGNDDDLVHVYLYKNDQFVDKETFTYSEGTDSGSGKLFSWDLSGQQGSGDFVILRMPAGSGDVPTPNADEDISVIKTAMATLSGSIATTDFIQSATEVITVSDLSYQGGAAEVTMKRRMARIDVVNTLPDTPVDIVSVNITKPAKEVNVWNQDLTGAPADYGSNYTVAAVDFTNKAANGAGTFYMLPTLIKQDGSGTIITVTTKNKSVDETIKTYVLSLQADQTIKANKRYKIIVTKKPDDSFIEFILTVADWDENEDEIGVDEVPAEPAVFGLFSSEAANTNELSGLGTYSLDFSDITQETVVKFEVETVYDADITFTQTSPRSTSLEGIDIQTSRALNSNDKYTTTVTYTLQPTAYPVEGIIEVKNPGGPADKKQYTVKRNPALWAGSLKCVETPNFFIAPTPLGADAASPLDNQVLFYLNENTFFNLGTAFDVNNRLSSNNFCPDGYVLMTKNAGVELINLTSDTSWSAPSLQSKWVSTDDGQRYWACSRLTHDSGASDYYFSMVFTALDNKIGTVHNGSINITSINIKLAPVYCIAGQK